MALRQSHVLGTSVGLIQPEADTLTVHDPVGERRVFMAENGCVTLLPDSVGRWEYEWSTGQAGSFDVVAPEQSAAGLVEGG
jgi:hypothetical protein